MKYERIKFFRKSQVDNNLFSILYKIYVCIYPFEILNDFKLFIVPKVQMKIDPDFQGRKLRRVKLPRPFLVQTSVLLVSRFQNKSYQTIFSVWCFFVVNFAFLKKKNRKKRKKKKIIWQKNRPSFYLTSDWDDFLYLISDWDDFLYQNELFQFHQNQHLIFAFQEHVPLWNRQWNEAWRGHERVLWFVLPLLRLELQMWRRQDSIVFLIHAKLFELNRKDLRFLLDLNH